MSEGTSSDIAMIGLGVMGKNIARNIERNGFNVALYNRSPEATRIMLGENPGKNFIPCSSLEDLCKNLKRPRKVLLMVKAGEPVDAVVTGLVDHLEPEDIIIDLGNSLYLDTERRQRELIAKGIHFLGVGVSGGEEGALWGPSIMPGGDKKSWQMLAPIFDAISAKVPTPCHTYIGPGGAGHFVKTIHNGIEYADMQLIAESYHLLKVIGGLKPSELATTFKDWNKGPLSSFLIEITGNIFEKLDDDSQDPLIDKILDKAEQKGTGRWTVEAALNLGVSAPSLTMAVDSRILSSEKDLRIKASSTLDAQAVEGVSGKSDSNNLTSPELSKLKLMIHDALYAAKIISYAQGFSIFSKASMTWEWNLPLDKIAEIWRGGCIIRAAFLDKIAQAYKADPDLSNLLLSELMQEEIKGRIQTLRSVIILAVQRGIPLLAHTSALGYYDSLRTALLPLNLTQAQRDYFGAHTFERIDRPGKFHVEWV